jgi:hypothetical protein
MVVSWFHNVSHIMMTIFFMPQTHGIPQLLGPGELRISVGVASTEQPPLGGFPSAAGRKKEQTRRKGKFVHICWPIW